MAFHEVRPEVIYNIIKEIKANKAPGYDGITPKMVKALPDSALLVLTNIFKDCLYLNYFPKACKIAELGMIPKPGKDKKDYKNYRSFSLLPVVGKLLEKVIHKRLVKVVDERKLIPAFQVGFRRGISTTHQITRKVENVTSGFNKN